jgi:hypothetical protein
MTTPSCDAVAYALRDAVDTLADLSRAFYNVAKFIARTSHSTARIQLTSCCKKKCENSSIFLDTEFHQIYTFVSCNFMGRSVDKSSIGRIGKMATKKAAKKVAKKAKKK